MNRILRFFSISFFVLAAPFIAHAATIEANTLPLLYGEDANDAYQYVDAVATGDLNGDGFEDLLTTKAYYDSGTSDVGAVYLLRGSATTRTTAELSSSIVDTVFIGESTNSYTGASIATGDVNNDGYDDILIGAYNDDTGGANAGAAFLIYGKADSYGSTKNISTADTVFLGEAVGDSAGSAVAIADVNGDGFEDILIGASDNNIGGNNAGAVYLIYGQSTSYGATKNLSTATTKFIGETAEDQAGVQIATGNLNGDAFQDIVIYASVQAEGRVYVMYGQSSSYGSTKDLSTASSILSPSGGESVLKIATGNMDGDAYDDLFISTVAGDVIGRVYVKYGQSGAFATTIDIATISAKINGVATNDLAGVALSLGDVNNDGYDDLLVSAYLSDANGRVYVLYGSAIQLTGTSSFSNADITINGETAGDIFGNALAVSSINGDGFAELLISAPGENTGGTGAGSLYIAYIYIDADDDGVAGTDGYSDGTDCNDSDAAVSSNQTYYRDADGDGLGTTATTESVCSATPSAGYVANDDDTNDVDADNDGVVTSEDCNDADATVSSTQTYYRDVDGDGLGKEETLLCASSAPAGYVSNNDDTNDNVSNAGIEISGDDVDNDGDGKVDEKNTLKSNGAHPTYSLKDATSTNAYTNSVEKITGGKDGKLIVTFADSSVYAYTVFDIDTDAKVIVKSWKGTGNILVLHPKGKKIALVNVYTGKVKEKETLAKETKYGKNSLKTFDLLGDGSSELVVTSKQDSAVRTVILKVKPTKDNKLAKKSSSTQSVSEVDVTKTELKKKKINLRNSKSKVQFTFTVNSSYQLIAQ